MSFPFCQASSAGSEGPKQPGPDELVQRAHENARMMTLRGMAIRVISFASGVLLLALVTPLEYGFFAVVRGIVGIVEGSIDQSLGFSLLRQPQDPAREEYAAFAGAQLSIVVLVLLAACIWPYAALGFGAIGSEWYSWMLATLAAMLATAWGSGARIRLERDLHYSRLAFLEISSISLHGVLLLGAAILDRFAYGVFAAQIVLTLYQNALLHRWSPGPLPILRPRPVLSRLGQSTGFSTAYGLQMIRDFGTPVLIANLFGLNSAGLWAFAARVGVYLQFAFESFGRVALPAAVRLRGDATSLRRLAADSLTGAATLTLPAAGILFVSLPVLVILWPQWRPAVPLAQVYVVSFGIAGVFGASLLPVSIALRGWRVAFMEHLIQTLAMLVALLTLWQSGGSNLALIVVPLQAIAVVTFILMADRNVRPSFDARLLRVGLSLATGLGLYALCGLLGVPTLVQAVAASAGIVLWIHPKTYLASIYSKAADS
jgi:O-antigen/teichoic acid export membrane protein